MQGDEEDVFMDTDDRSEVTTKPLRRTRHFTEERGGGISINHAASDAPDISWGRSPGCGRQASDVDREYHNPVAPAYDSSTAEWCSSGYESEYDEDDDEVCTPERQYNYGSPHTGCSQAFEDAHLIDSDATLSDTGMDGAPIQDSPYYSQSTQCARMDEQLQSPLTRKSVLPAAAAAVVEVMDQDKPPKQVDGMGKRLQDIARQVDKQGDSGKCGKCVWDQPSPPAYGPAKRYYDEKDEHSKHQAYVEDDVDDSETEDGHDGVSLVPDTVVPSIEAVEAVFPPTSISAPGADARAYPTPRPTPPTTTSSTVHAAPGDDTFFFSPLPGTVITCLRARQASYDARRPALYDRMRRSEGPSPSPTTPPPNFGANSTPTYPSDPYYTFPPHTQPSSCTTFPQSGSYTSPYGPASSYTHTAAGGAPSGGIFSLAPSSDQRTPNPSNHTPSSPIYTQAVQHSISAGFSDRRTQLAKKYPTPKRKVPAEDEMLTGFERLKKRRPTLEMRMSEVWMGEVLESGVGGVPSGPDGVALDLRIEGGAIDDRLLEGGAEFVICEDETVTEPQDPDGLA